MTDDKIFLDNGREFFKATGLRVWPSRNREHPSAKPGCEQHKGPLIDVSLVRTLLNRLDELERGTRPSAGAQTAAGKDLAAFQALQAAGRLVSYIAGWAIDHQVGLAMKGLSFVPLGTSQTKAHPDYLAARQAVDSHEHERSGGSARTMGLDADAQRAALINLLTSNPGGFPGEVQQPAVEALDALNFEEVLPMLSPAKGNRKVKLLELRLQLQVVGFVEFQIATGIKKLEALKTASRVLNVAESTISGWEYRLRAELGQLTVTRTLSRFTNWGSSFKRNQERRAAGDTDATPELFERLGGLPALQIVAEKYHALRRG